MTTTFDKSDTSANANLTQDNIPDRKWWKEAVVYQIYPRSFKDSDGDGIGDLRGIISKLDYIQSLGIDVVWLNPIYTSPNDDNGYDISNYRGIMKEFGTMQDFDELLNGLHTRGIKLVLDFVPNHCSDEHLWFQFARSARDNIYRDYFHWWPAEKGKPTRRWSFFDVSADAWTLDTTTNSYYLHYFSAKQPDLNWENMQLRFEMYGVMKFWLDKGVDGFRMDVIPFISKDTTFPPLPGEYRGDFVKYYAKGPKLHQYLREMNEEVLSKYDIMTVAEGCGTTMEDAPQFIDPDRKELNMLYHFDGMDIGYVSGEFKRPDPKGYSLLQFKEVYTKWDSVFAKGWGTVYLGNHDQPRMVTRWGNDSAAFRELSSKMLTTFLLSMRATPYYYNGDELGMNNIKFDKIDDYKDIESRNMYRLIKSRGGDLQQFLNDQKIAARDNGRTPFQWDDTRAAGFTTGLPWLKVNPNYKTVNVASEEKDPNSVLNYFKKMIQLRKQHLVLVYGEYNIIDKDNISIYAYTRELNEQKLLVLLNFSDKEATTTTGLDLNKGSVLINNYPEDSIDLNGDTATLKPYQAIIFTLSY